MFAFLFMTVCVVTAHAFEREVCKDETFRCKGWKHFCTDKYNKAYMELYCKDTCGFCPKCQDLFPGCNVLDCNDASSEDFLRKNCRLSCGICVPPTKAPPKPTTRAWKVKPAGKCGVKNVFGSRVIGGIDAQKGAWPWQVLIRLGGSTHCGGSLINPFWVVTAAHCVYHKEALINYFKVITGEHDFNVKEGTETSIGLSKIIVHKDYSPSTLDYDIALLKLNRPAPFGKYVATVCLPEYNDPIPVGTMCTITGWGKVSSKGRMHHKLQQAQMPIISNSKCYNLNTNDTNIKVTDRMVCAGYGPNNIISGCHGDSGGPLVCYSRESNQWFLQGAVSWGSSTCDTKKAYTVFARVSYLRKWIDENTNDY